MQWFIRSFTTSRINNLLSFGFKVVYKTTRIAGHKGWDLGDNYYM